MRPSIFTLTFASLVLSSSPAFAGWTAKQSSTSGGKTEMADLSFDNDFFRIDSGQNAPSVIIDFGAGRLTFLNHEKKKHASITLEEVMAMRDQQIAMMKKELPKMQPEMRKQVEEQIKLAEGNGKDAKKSLALKDSKKKDKINGYDCEVYTWTAPDGDGEACIAAKAAGVDPASFKKA